MRRGILYREQTFSIVLLVGGKSAAYNKNSDILEVQFWGILALIGNTVDFG